MLKEIEVRESVINLFKQKASGQDNYIIIREPFNVGVIPDVVAFRWVDDYQIEAIAVECKGSKGDTLAAKYIIDFATEQAREYQAYFPYVYLATPRVSESEEEVVRKILATLRIGWICVNNKKANLQSEALVSPRLVESEYIIKVRQRLLAIWAYNKVFEKNFNKFNRNLMEPEVVHCFTKEDFPNFLLTNHWGDYYCGICLEQQPNVKAILPNIKPDDFHRLLQELPEEFIAEFAYIDTYKPKVVLWPLLRKKANQLSLQDVNWLKDFAKRMRWKIRIMLLGKVWGRSEILSSDEHKRILEKVKEEITPVKEYLASQNRKHLRSQ